MTAQTNLPKLTRHADEFLTFLCLLLVSCLPALSQSITAANGPHGAPHDPQTDTAFDHFYNMDYDRATQEFEKIVEKHPNDPFAVNHLLTSVLIHDLYDTGAMNTGDYANDSFIGRTPRPTDTKIKDRIKELVRRAEALEEQELKTNSKDVNALYCRGVTRAQFSVYTGLVERAFEKIRQASRGMPAVMIRQLEALTKIMEHTAGPAQRQLLLDQAAMIYRASVESVPEPSDVADVKHEYDEVLRAAAQMAELDAVEQA